MMLLVVMVLGLLMILGLLTYALILALQIPKEDNEQKIPASMFEFPHLFPWPIK